jgi:Flp pilus assembly protein TadD
MKNSGGLRSLRVLGIRLLPAGVALLWAAALAARPIGGLDFWWHLKTGEWIVSNFSIPRVDFYSFTAAGAPWIDLHWLFQVVLYGGWAAGGAVGVVILQVGLVFLTFVLVWKEGERSVGFSWALVVAVLLSGIMARDRLHPRPELFTFCFVAAYQFLLGEFWRGTRRSVWILIPLQLLWGNSHGLSVLGPVMAGGVLLALLLRREAGDRGRLIHAVKVLAVLCVAGFCNPYGWEGARYPWVLFSEVRGGVSILKGTIQELAPPWSSYQPTWSVSIYRWTSPLILGFFLWGGSRDRLRLVWVGIFFGLSLLAVRNVALFALVAAPAMAEHLSTLWRRLPGEVPSWMSRVAVIAWMSAGGVFLWGRLDSEWSHPRSWMDSYRYPAGAARFLEEEAVTGEVFSSGIGVGGYFVWRLWPDRRVFSDGRLEVYGPAFFEEYLRMLEDPIFFEERTRHWKINAVVLEHGIGRNDPLLGYLEAAAHWVPVHFDPVTVCYLRDIPEHREIIERRRVLWSMSEFGWKEFGRLSGEERVSLGNLFARIGIEEEALSVYQAALGEGNGGTAEIHVNLGHLHARAGRLEDARQSYEEALRFDKKHPEAHHGLGRLLVAQGMLDEGVRHLRKAVRYDPRMGGGWISLGDGLKRKGDLKGAERAYRRVSLWDPSYSQSVNHLAGLLAEEGRSSESESLLEGLLRHRPHFIQAHLNLAILYRQKGALDAAERASHRARELESERER